MVHLSKVRLVIIVLCYNKKNILDRLLSNDISSISNLLKARFTLPEGLNLNDVILSCVISDELPTTKYGFVTKEPTLKAKFNVQLLDKYSMPFNHYVGHANTAFDEKVGSRLLNGSIMSM